MTRLLVAVAVAAAGAAVAPARAANGDAVRSVTITYAATGGTELDRASGTFRASAVCSGTVEGMQEIRDIAWRAKFRRIELPRPGRSVVVEAPVEFTGTGRVDTEFRSDPACGNEVPQSTECSGPLHFEGRRAALRLRWIRPGGVRRLEISLRALSPADSPGEDPPETEPTPDRCPLGVRERAFDADLRAPATARRLVLLRPDSTANANAEPEERRPHVEEHERNDEFTYDSVSDVTWAAVVAVRYNRR